MALALSLNKLRLVKCDTSLACNHYCRALNTTGIPAEVRPEYLTDLVFQIGVKLLGLVRNVICGV